MFLDEPVDDVALGTVEDVAARRVCHAEGLGDVPQCRFPRGAIVAGVHRGQQHLLLAVGQQLVRLARVDLADVLDSEPDAQVVELVAEIREPASRCRHLPRRRPVLDVEGHLERHAGPPHREQRERVLRLYLEEGLVVVLPEQLDVLNVVAGLDNGYERQQVGGPIRKQREVLATTTAARNAAVALFIATGGFSNPNVLAVVPGFSFVSVVGAGILASAWR
jgi:hypothetical protein